MFKSLTINELLKVGIVTLILGVIYMAYFFLIGIPKTNARSYYNKSVLDLQANNTALEKQDLQKAVNSWPEPYIVQKLNSL